MSAALRTCATATRDTITVSWGHPCVDNKAAYWLWIYGPPGSVPIVHRNASVFPPGSEYTYTGLQPVATYRIVVMHNDIVRARATVTVTTEAAPAAGSGEPSSSPRSAVTPPATQTWPLTGPFAPVWPAAAFRAEAELPFAAGVVAFYGAGVIFIATTFETTLAVGIGLLLAGLTIALAAMLWRRRFCLADRDAAESLPLV